VTTMHSYNATLSMNLNGDAEVVEQWGLAVLDALMDLDDVIGADLTATLSLGVVAIDFGLKARDLEDAWLQAATAVRTALHVCGANTVGMDQQIAQVQTSVREQSRITVDA
jgi:hypothetical protein